MRLGTYLFIILILTIDGCSPEKGRTKAAISDITVSLYAAANVKAKDQYQVLSKVPGIIMQIEVEPGDRVKAGDVLFVLEHGEAALNTANARQAMDFTASNFRTNSERLQEAALQVQAAQEKYMLDSSIFFRQKSLWDQNIGTRLEFDQRRLAFSTSKINYDLAAKGLIQLKKQLTNELTLSRINYGLSRKRQNDYVIQSEIDGQVFDINIHKGELINPQTELGILGKPDHFYLEMNVDERDITQVKPGQRVEITMDSYKGRSFTGQVSKIYPIMNQRSRTFKVEAEFVDHPGDLYPNLTAEVNIIVAVKQKAMLIPRSYLDNNNFVWLKGNIKRKVKTGVQDERNVEIIRGLDTSETIYKPVQ